MKNDVRDTGKTEYYYVLLHEVGHVLGIGAFWGLNGVPIVSYQEDGLTKYYYTGQHAVREYKRHLSPIANDIVGIPFAVFVTGELVTPGAPTLPAASTQTTA